MQYARIFECNYICDADVDTQLNTFLEEHPNYKVDKIFFACKEGKCYQRLFVVFDVSDETQSNAER